MQQDESVESAKFIRLAQLVPDVIPVSRSTIWRWVRRKAFPRPVKLAPRVTAWRWSDVEAWLSKQAATGGAE